MNERKTLSDKQLLKFLINKEGWVSMTDIKKRFGVNPRTAQYHLEKLSEEGFVEKRIPKYEESGHSYGTKYRSKPELLSAKPQFWLACFTTALMITVMIMVLIYFSLENLLISLSALCGNIIAVFVSWYYFLKVRRLKEKNILEKLKS